MVTDYNETQKQIEFDAEVQKKEQDFQESLYKIFVPLLGVLIIILNIGIVVTSGLILHAKKQPRSTYIFLGNVALSDLVLGIAILFGQFYPIKLRSEMICCMIIIMTVGSTFSSLYSVMLIGIDRYLFILYGLQYQRYLNSCRARIFVLLTWIFGFVVAGFPAIGYNCLSGDGRFCWFITMAPTDILVTTSVLGLIPLFVIIILYTIILKHALQKVRELREASNSTTGARTGNIRLFRGNQHLSTEMEYELENLKLGIQINEDNIKTNKLKIKKISKKEHVYNPSKWRAIKIVLYTTGSFFVTWVPYFFATFLYALCDMNKTPQYCSTLRNMIASPLALLGLCNSLLNPIVYAWWHNGFRASVRKIYYRTILRKSNLYSESSKTRSSIFSSKSSERSVDGKRKITNRNKKENIELLVLQIININPE